MTYPENSPSMDDMLNMPTGELAQMPVELLANLQAELAHAAKQLKSASTKFSTAMEMRYATRAAEARRACGRDTGTVRIIDGDYTVVADLPKRVDWDQAKLAAMAERIAESDENPAEFIETKLTVSERKYTALPGSWRKGFETARTVRPGTLKITIEPNEAAQ